MRLRSRRRLAQIAAFAACNVGFTAATETGLVVPFMYCHGCPLASFACPIGALQHFLGKHTAPLLVIGLLGLSFVVLGRGACGWLCPFGAIQDLLRALAQGKGPPGARLGGKPCRESALLSADRVARKAKFLVLAATAVSSFVLLGPTFCWFCPIGALFAGIPYKLTHPGTRLGLPLYVHLSILAAVLIAALLIPRAWCRYICPLGAIAGLFNRISIVRVELDEGRCTACGACLRACPMGLRSLSDVGKSAECLLCGRCVEACPSGALRMGVSLG